MQICKKKEKRSHAGRQHKCASSTPNTPHICLYSDIHFANFDQAVWLRRWERYSTAQGPGGGLIYTAVVDHIVFHSNMLGPIHTLAVAASDSHEIALQQSQSKTTEFDTTQEIWLKRHECALLSQYICFEICS